MFISLIIFLGVIILLVAGVVGGIVIFIAAMNARDKGKGKFDFKMIIKLYLYFITLVTLVISSLAAINIIKAGLTFVGGYQLSYNVNTYYEDTYEDEYNYLNYGDNQDIIEIDGVKYTVDKDARTKDLLNGLILLIFGIIIFGVHRLGIYFIERDDADKPSIFEKIYIFSVLILFSIVSIIAIPTAIYQLVNFLFIDSDNLGDYGISHPGEPIATALVTTPIWIIFVIRAIMVYRASRRDDVVEA